jgi:8-hydroxy-5-deazaflavin:NADPH oxidoreductase
VTTPADTEPEAATAPTIGIIGAGRVGTALARLGIGAGHRVLIAGSPRQSALHLLVSVVAPGAEVVDATQIAAQSDIVIVAVPFGKAATVPWDHFDEVIVVDAMNYWSPVDGVIDAAESEDRSTSELTATYNARMRLVKSLNHLGYHDMEDDSRPAGDPLRRAIAVASDDVGAKDAVAAFIDAIGFDVVDAGPLAAGRALQPGHFVFGRELSADELEAAIERDRTAGAAA